MVSLSKSALILSPCLTWAGDGAKAYEDELADTSKRDRGIEFHDAMDAYYRRVTKHLSISPMVAPWVAAAISWSQEHLEPLCELLMSEVYVSYDFANGHVHTDPGVKNRGYPKMPGFVPGTADLVCIFKTGELYIGDWKTGLGTGAKEQLLSLACGLRKAFRKPDGGARPVVIACLYAGEAAGAGKGVLPNVYPVSEETLVAHERAMAMQLSLVGGSNRPSPGIHCTQLYCPHLAYCSGIMETVNLMADAGELVQLGFLKPKKYSLTDKPTSDEEAGYVMERIYAAKRHYQYLDAAVRKYINNGGRAVAGDFEFKETRSGFRWVGR